MKILVAFASKYGATSEIAAVVGRVLASCGHDVDVLPFQQAGRLGDYDGFVLGSAVYAGRWLKRAVAFVDANRGMLADRPVWLFSSGPVGAGPIRDADTADIKRISAVVRPRGHRVFAGKLEKSRLNPIERLIFAVVRARDGDYRDWAAVAEWAGDIGREITQVTAVVQAGAGDGK